MSKLLDDEFEVKEFDEEENAQIDKIGAEFYNKLTDLTQDFEETKIDLQNEIMEWGIFRGLVCMLVMYADSMELNFGHIMAEVMAFSSSEFETEMSPDLEALVDPERH